MAFVEIMSSNKWLTYKKLAVWNLWCAIINNVVRLKTHCGLIVLIDAEAKNALYGRSLPGEAEIKPQTIINLEYVQKNAHKQVNTWRWVYIIIICLMYYIHCGWVMQQKSTTWLKCLFEKHTSDQCKTLKSQ